MDRKPLTYLSTFKDIMKRMFRWIQYVEEIGVKLVYVPGRENVLADFLSRNIKKTPSSRVITCDSIKFKIRSNLITFVIQKMVSKQFSVETKYYKN